MKMELSVEAPVDGIVEQVCCTEGRGVLIAQTLVVLRSRQLQEKLDAVSLH
jgi:biotin carboxyl carrier protein